MFQNYIYKGEPVLDIVKWCKDNNDKLLRLYWESKEPLLAESHFYQTLLPKSWHDISRITKDILLKTEEVDLDAEPQ